MRTRAFYETRSGFKATLSLNDLYDYLWIDIMLPKFLNQDDIVYKDSNVEITNSTRLGAFFNITSAAATIRINGMSTNSRYCIKCREEGIDSELLYNNLNKAFMRLAREFDERSTTTLTDDNKTPDRLSISVKVVDNMVTVRPLIIPKWFVDISYQNGNNICIISHNKHHIYIYNNIEMYGSIRVCIPSYRNALDEGFDWTYAGFVLHLKDSHTAQEFGKRLKSTVKSLNKKYTGGRKG